MRWSLYLRVELRRVEESKNAKSQEGKDKSNTIAASVPVKSRRTAPSAQTSPSDARPLRTVLRTSGGLGGRMPARMEKCRSIPGENSGCRD